MRNIIGIIIAITLTITALSPVSADAAMSSASASDISIKGEYLIRDNDGMHSRYVVLAENTSPDDISVKADFHALSSDGKEIKTVHDVASAVKSGQTFIIYGQYLNDAIADAASFSYDLHVNSTSGCRYDAVSVDVSRTANDTIAVSGTNYSKSDVIAVNVRGVFYKDGVPVAFDTVNIGDQGYVLSGGAGSVQELMQTFTDYDDYVITYFVEAKNPLPEEF